MGSLFIATFFLALHIFSIIYINSSFLLQFGGTTFVGALYIAGAIAGLIGLGIAPYLLRTLGVLSLTIALSTTELITVLSLGTARSLAEAGVLFVVYWVSTILLLYCLDIFIESEMHEERDTGIVRGGVLTIANAALFICPVLGGIIVESSGFQGAYTLGSLALIPFVIVLIVKFRRFTDAHYPHIALLGALKRLRGMPKLQSIFFLHLLLRIFFSVTVIYLPLYLLDSGFAWSEVGLILSLMLVPLVLFELPVGEFAEKIDERLLFAVGFLMLAGNLATVATIHNFSIALIGIILFAAHSGGAILEVTSETAFFKRVTSKDADLISLFRMLRSVGYILAPGIGATLIPFVGFPGFFTAIALLLFLGTPIALQMARD